MAERIFSGQGKTGLCERRPGLAAIGQYKAGYHREGMYRLRQPYIGIGYCREDSLGFLRVNPISGEQRQ